MSSIGEHRFLQLTGAINPGGGEQLEDITRPGIDGVAWRRIGKRGIPFQLRSVVNLSSADKVQTQLISYQQTQGQIVNIVDQHALSWDGYLVLRVLHRRTQALLSATTDNHGRTKPNTQQSYLLTVDWLLQAIVQ